MYLPPFELERWFARYEFNVKFNLCASCAGASNTAELLELAGPGSTDTYLGLNLDYIPSEGSQRLREAVSDMYTSLSSENIRITTGASEAIFLLMNSLLEPGDEVIVQYPIYQSLFSLAESMGCRVSCWRGEFADNFVPRLDALETLLTPRTKIVIINTPHSPTGMVFETEMLQAIVEMVGQNGALLVSDEVYRGLFLGLGPEPPAAADLSSSAVSIGDLTKPFGLGGLRVGWIASGNTGILERCAVLRDYTTMCCAAPSEFLAVTALENRDFLLKNKKAAAERNLKLLSNFVDQNQAALEWVSPLGGVSAFPRLDLPVSAREFCTALVEEKSVLLLPGDVFGFPQHFRIGFGAEPGAFAEGLAAVGEFLQESFRS